MLVIQFSENWLQCFDIVSFNTETIPIAIGTAQIYYISSYLLDGRQKRNYPFSHPKSSLLNIRVQIETVRSCKKNY